MIKYRNYIWGSLLREKGWNRVEFVLRCAEILNVISVVSLIVGRLEEHRGVVEHGRLFVLVSLLDALGLVLGCRSRLFQVHLLRCVLQDVSGWGVICAEIHWILVVVITLRLLLMVLTSIQCNLIHQIGDCGGFMILVSVRYIWEGWTHLLLWLLLLVKQGWLLGRCQLSEFGDCCRGGLRTAYLMILILLWLKWLTWIILQPRRSNWQVYASGV